MEDSHRAQLATYVQKAYKSGASIDAIRAQLLKSGWRDDIVEPVLAEFQVAHKSADPHRVRNAVLWIVSPFILFGIAALAQFIMRFTLNSSDNMGVISIFRIVINIFSLIFGLVAVPLIIVGPIVGILKLSKKQG